ncbi:hypothetical protein [Butyrivibrio sp. VCB2006]|uniref:hypothetical protein n=1 Tax=Butyrivibrio sp. VCB2006 TaxID=1280679 RepID=UPI0004278D4B|nr:hypothetical protein [Butyrivibrio sp. VCB2006]
MNEPKYDPVTGEPTPERLQELLNAGYKYDPVTGKPVVAPSQQTTQQIPAQAPVMPASASISAAAGATSGNVFQRLWNNQGSRLAIVAVGMLTLILILVGVAGNLVTNGSRSNNHVGNDPDVNNSDPGRIMTGDPDIDFAEPEPDEVTHAIPGSQASSDIDYDGFTSFTINGYSYELPQKVQDFLDDDWVFNDDNKMEEILYTGESTYVDLHVPGDISTNTISFTITNFSLNAQPAKDCYITKVEFYESYVTRKGNEISIQNGDLVLCESDIDDVKKVLGEPDYASDFGTSQALTYYLDHDNSNYKCQVSLHFDEDSDKLSIISIRAEVEPGDFVQSDVQEGIPEYLTYYEAPASLGDDPLSGNFQLEGKVYNLPVPLSILIEDGWSYGDDDLAVGAGEGYSLTLYKEDKYIFVEAFNFIDKAVYLENTMVTNISVYSSTQVDLKFPGGVDTSITDKEYAAFLEKNGLSNFEYKKDYHRYRVPLDQSAKVESNNNIYRVYFEDDGSLQSLELERLGWLVD